VRPGMMRAVVAVVVVLAMAASREDDDWDLVSMELERQPP